MFREGGLVLPFIIAYFAPGICAIIYESSHITEILMSQQINDACHEGDGLWLPIIEYSVKSGLSLSTIRRKIKSNSIPFRLERGKYLLLFQPGTPAESTETQEPISAYVATTEKVVEEVAEPVTPKPRTPKTNSSDLEMVSGAFEHALNEKEQRIRLLETRNRDLEERLSELRLLVQVLEEKYEVRY